VPTPLSRFALSTDLENFSKDETCLGDKVSLDGPTEDPHK
jgi:hypothetical protein